MLHLHAYSYDTFECDQAIRGLDYIKAFKDGALIREGSGISDFSGYSLTGEAGNPVEFSKPEPTAEEHQAAIERAIMEMASEIYG